MTHPVTSDQTDGLPTQSTLDSIAITSLYEELSHRQIGYICRQFNFDRDTAANIVQNAYMNLLSRNISPKVNYPARYVWRSVINAAIDYYNSTHAQCRDVRQTRALTDYHLNTMNGDLEVQEC